MLRSTPFLRQQKLQREFSHGMTLIKRTALLVVFFTICVSSVFAKNTLRVMTYNIHVGVGMDKKLDPVAFSDQEHGPPHV